MVELSQHHREVEELRNRRAKLVRHRFYYVVEDFTSGTTVKGSEVYKSRYEQEIYEDEYDCTRAI